jgi:hypothetical protein
VTQDWRWYQRTSAKWLRWRAVNHELHVGSVIRQLKGASLSEAPVEFLNNVLRVFDTHAKRDDRSGIVQHSVADLWL